MLSDGKRVKLSKFLSLVLRHRPEAVGLTLDSAGWVAVALLLEGCRRTGRAITPEQLREMVETSDKRRFELSPRILLT
jgi:putative RNA 2'-phosphotransferase